MKKKLLTAAVLLVCAVALVVGSVLTTMALLTSSATVSNVFTIGKVSIAMFESKVDGDGQIITPATKVDTNSYHLLPGETYDKDPTIYITTENDSDEMYLFVKSENMIRSAEAGNFTDRVRADAEGTFVEGQGHTPLSMREQMHANGWVEYVRSGDGSEIVWVYGTRDESTGKITPIAVDRTKSQFADSTPGEFRLCQEFTIHPDVDTNLYGAAKVVFSAFAVQTKGFAGDTSTDHALTYAAWDAVKKSFPYQCGIVSPKNPYKLDATDPYAAIPNSKAQFELFTPPVQNTTNPDQGDEQPDAQS